MALNLSNWPAHELRLAYFDFTCRGEGDPALVEAVLREWLNRRAIDHATYRLWLDALAWREAGNLLPGWTASQPEGGRPLAAGTEADAERFAEWRQTKVAA